MSSVGVKELTRALKAAFTSGEPTYPDLAPPAEVTAIADAFLAAHHAALPSDADAARLTETLADITNVIARGKEKGPSIGRANAWIILLAQLRELEGDSLSKDLIATQLWPALIRRALLHTNDTRPFTCSREGIAAAKALLVWTCGKKPDEEASLGPFEEEILADYLSLTSFGGDSEKQTSHTQSRLRGSEHLEDVLISVGKQRPKALLGHLAQLLPTKPNRRPAVLRLVGDFCRMHPAQAYHALPTKLLDHLLLAVLLDTDVHVVHLALSSIVFLLPSILTSWEPLLPFLLVAYARAVSLANTVPGRAEVVVAPELEESSASDHPLMLPLREGLTWQPSDATKPGIEEELNESDGGVVRRPDKLPLAPVQELFSLLYAFLPCNLLAFLKEPVAFLKEKQWQPLFADQNILCFDPGELRDRSHWDLQRHVFNPAVLFHTPASELAELSRMGQVDAAEVALRCHSLSVEPGPPKAPSITDENADVSNISSISDNGAMGPHVALRTAVTIPESPSLAAVTSSPSRVRPSGSFDHATRVAHLEREISLLRADLAYEQHLKAQHAGRLGALHRERIKAASGDAERQALHDALRIYKARLTNAEALIKQSRTEAGMSKAQHRDWSKRQQTRIANLKEAEKQAREREQVDEAKLQAAQATIAEQTKELEIATNKLFDLENQAKIDAPKLEERADLEARLRRLTQHMLVWDQDMMRARNQRKRMEAIISDWQKALQQQEADAKGIEELCDELAAEQKRAHQLETSRPPAPKSATPALPPTSARGHAILREQYQGLRERAKKLEEELIELRTSPQQGQFVPEGSVLK